MGVFSSWYCGGGQGPIPPHPPAITSPGRVITLILLHSDAHLGFLLLCIWTHRYIPWMKCHSRNIPGICRYIPGIFRIPERGKAAGSDGTPGPLAFYSEPALCLGSSLTSTRIPVIFCRDVHIITFLILWISSICHVSRMTKGNEASRAASQAKKEKETTKKKERETWNRFLRWQWRQQSNWKSSTETRR